VIAFDPEVTGRDFDEFFFVAESFDGVAGLPDDSLDDPLLRVLRAYQTYDFSPLNCEISGFVLK
jgi:hypothetical protein